MICASLTASQKYAICTRMKKAPDICKVLFVFYELLFIFTIIVRGEHAFSAGAFSAGADSATKGISSNSSEGISTSFDGENSDDESPDESEDVPDERPSGRTNAREEKNVIA